MTNGRYGETELAPARMIGANGIRPIQTRRVTAVIRDGLSRFSAELARQFWTRQSRQSD
jgi:hypothetical protein